MQLQGEVPNYAKNELNRCDANWCYYCCGPIEHRLVLPLVVNIVGIFSFLPTMPCELQCTRQIHNYILPALNEISSPITQYPRHTSPSLFLCPMKRQPRILHLRGSYILQQLKYYIGEAHALVLTNKLSFLRRRINSTQQHLFVNDISNW